MRRLDGGLGQVHRIVLMLASVWLMIAVSVTPAAAHGGGTPQVVDAPAGPYRLFAWTTPDPWRAGEVAHITVAVTRVDAAGQVFPVADAQVMIRLTSETQPEQTLTLPAQPVSAVATGFYELDHKFPGDGLWRIEVEARGAEGVGVVAFTMAVESRLPPPRGCCGRERHWRRWSSHLACGRLRVDVQRKRLRAAQRSLRCRSRDKVWFFSSFSARNGLSSRSS